MTATVIQHPASFAGHSPYLDGAGRERLASWIRERIDPAQGKYQCVLFALAHTTDRGDTVVTAAPPVSKKATDAEREQAVSRLVDEFDSSSRAFAAAEPRTQRFVVCGYFSEQKGAEADFRFPFAVEPATPTLGKIGESDETSTAQTFGHLSRMLDVTLRQLTSNMQQNMDRIAEENRDLRAHARTLEKDRWEHQLQREQLLDQKALRDVTVLKTQMDMQLQHRLYMEAAGFITKFLTKYAESKGIISDKGNPLIAFVQTLEPMQLLQFVGNMSDEQRKAFEPLMQQIVLSLPEEKKQQIMQLMAVVKEGQVK